MYSGIEERRLVMSKDQISDKSDDSMITSVPQSLALSREAKSLVLVDDDIDDDDDDDDDMAEASSMQFATERIVKHFSRCICASAGEIFRLLLFRIRYTDNQKYMDWIFGIVFVECPSDSSNNLYLSILLSHFLLFSNRM